MLAVSCPTTDAEASAARLEVRATPGPSRGVSARLRSFTVRWAGRLGQPTPAEKESVGRPPLYSAYINRRLGYLIARLLRPHRVSPNQVTMASALVTYGAILCLATVEPSWLMSMVVSAGLLIGYALDSADGQLSRLRGQSTLAGEWFDHMVDCGKMVAVHLAVLISWYRFAHSDSPAFLLVPIGFTVVSSMTYFGMIMADQFRRRADYPREQTGTNPTPAWRRLAALPTDYGVLCLTFLFFSHRSTFTISYVFIFVVSSAFLVSRLTDWRREIAAMDNRRDRSA